jgi:hypothetical protein
MHMTRSCPGRSHDHERSTDDRARPQPATGGATSLMKLHPFDSPNTSSSLTLEIAELYNYIRSHPEPGLQSWMPVGVHGAAARPCDGASRTGRQSGDRPFHGRRLASHCSRHLGHRLRLQHQHPGSLLRTQRGRTSPHAPSVSCRCDRASRGRVAPVINDERNAKRDLRSPLAVGLVPSSQGVRERTTGSDV